MNTTTRRQHVPVEPRATRSGLRSSSSVPRVTRSFAKVDVAFFNEDDDEYANPDWLIGAY